MKIKNIVKLSVLCFAFGNLSAQNPWPKATNTAQPWTRWWWMGSAVDEKGLDKQLTTLSNAGFGGVEIVPIYGAKGFENKYINYLSPEWMKMLQLTTDKAKSLKMGVDMAVGTGWPIGGPQVDENDAATKMIVQTYEIQQNEKFSEKIVLKDEKQKNLKTTKLDIVTAYNEKNEAVVLTDKVTQDGTLNWKPTSGKWTIYAIFVGKTLQKVKRAAPGGDGYTLDHFSPYATKDYLKSFDKAFGSSNYGIRSFFNDSYEVYGADWTANFKKEEFKKRRGYDLSQYIKYLVSDEESELAGRIKSDYRETMSELILHNFTENFTNWAHSKNSQNTNQAHGSPGNLLDLYAAVDIPESETFGSTKFDIQGLRRNVEDINTKEIPDINMLKFASSAANITGKPLISNESFTWLTEHFKTSWSQVKPEAEQIFLSGINHIFYHGTTYTPADVQFPGWLFYASTNFVPENSLWPNIKGLNSYIQRTQSVLQSGKSDNEILMYWPVYDQWASPKGKDMAFKIHNIEKWLHPTVFYENLDKLGKSGYSLDMISDEMIGEAKFENQNIQVSKNGGSYKVLIIPQLNYFSESTLKNILNLAQNGASVIFQNEPKDVQGFFEFEKRRKELQSLWAKIPFQQDGNLRSATFGKGRIILSSDVEKALQFLKIEREKLTDTGLKFIRRKFDGGKYYYIVNHTSKEINQNIPLNYSGKQVALMNPENGEFGIAETQNNSVKVQLKSGESLIIKASETPDNSIPKWKYVEKTDAPIVLNQPWQLTFKEGGPELPKSKTLDKLQPWTNFTEDTSTQSFSGTGVYATSFKLNKKADDFILKFDKLYESAKVIINGQDAGMVWSLPFEINVGKYLKKGKNTIQIEVSNLMANRIRYMDQNKIQWRNYHEINFVNIDYKPFDASNWKVQPSGLDGEIQLIPVFYSNKL